MELIKAEEKLRDANKENNLLRKKCFEAIESEVEKKNAEFKSSPNPNQKRETSSPTQGPANVDRRASLSSASEGNPASLPNLNSSLDRQGYASAPLPGLNQVGGSAGMSSSPSTSSSLSSFFGSRRASKAKLDLDAGGRPFGVTVIPRHCVKWFKVEKGELNSIAFSPSGTHFITGGIEKEVRVWDSATLRPLVCTKPSLMLTY